MLSRPNRLINAARLVCLSGVVLGMAGLSGCETSPYSPGPDRTVQQRRAAFPIKGEDYAKIGYRLDWVGYPAVTGSLPIQYILPFDDMVVVQEAGSFVTVMEPNTGARRCADQLANPLSKFVGMVRDGDRILCCSEGEVFVLDTQTCNLLGRQRIEKIVATEPVRYGNLLIFGTGVGEVLAHMSNSSVNGIKAWGFLTEGAFVRKPALIGDAIGAVSQAGQVVFLDAQSGSLLGQNRIYGGLDTNPVDNESLMFVASVDQSIYAFSPVGATLVWRYRTAAPLRTQPTVNGDRLYCAIPGRGLTAFEANTGEVLWECKDFGGTVVGINKDRLVVWDGTEAALVDPARGDVLERAKLPGVSILKPDKFVDGNLYAVSRSGVVAKFQPR